MVQVHVRAPVFILNRGSVTDLILNHGWTRMHTDDLRKLRAGTITSLSVCIRVHPWLNCSGPFPFRRVVHGEQQTHLTQNQAALSVQVASRRPIHSRVAQQWSRRLLTGRVVVRIHPREPL